VGTERVEEEVNKAFPGARVVRMDVDTTRRKGAHQQILDGFRRGEYDVLIGTQMVAKGLDFPNVTLVGVVAADSGLRLPDYRASERTFQLLAQVAGRSGRGLRAGEVVIQTYSPDHYAVKAAASHDYEGFYHEEIGYRRSLGYPPFGELILLTASAVREEVSKSAAVEVFHAVEGILCGVASLLGPVPAPIARLRGRFRHQVLIKGGLPPGWREALKEAVRTVAQRQPEAVIQVSVRPQSLL
jgi:primosomal protein N' (replication factor Y)